MLLGRGIGAHQAKDPVRVVRVRRPDLLAVDDEVVAVLLRLALGLFVVIGVLGLGFRLGLRLLIVLVRILRLGFGFRLGLLVVLVGILYMLVLALALATLVYIETPLLLAVVPVTMWAAMMTFLVVVPESWYHQSRVHPVISMRAMSLVARPSYVA